jgi:hypothetical protein
MIDCLSFFGLNVLKRTALSTSSAPATIGREYYAHASRRRMDARSGSGEDLF